MAKSKEQKREEAIARSRKNWSAKEKEAMQHLMGGTEYKRIERDFGVASAKLNASSTWDVFKKWCASVGLDTHGNELKAQ
jgi:hypothetical protein